MLTPAQVKVLRQLKTQPMIDVAKMRLDTRLLVEAGAHVYEIEPLTFGSLTVEVSSNNPRFLQSTTGTYLSGVYVFDDAICFGGKIGKTLKMEIRFQNEVFLSEPALRVVVLGDGWSYEIF